MALIVALVSDPTQINALRLAGEVKGHEVIVVSSSDEALGVVARRVPDFLLCGLLLSPAEEAMLGSRLRASNVERLTPANRSTDEDAITATGTERRHVWLKLVTASTRGVGASDPRHFLAEIRPYLQSPPPHLASPRPHLQPPPPHVEPPPSHLEPPPPQLEPPGPASGAFPQLPSDEESTVELPSSRAAVSEGLARIFHGTLLTLRAIPLSDVVASVRRGGLLLFRSIPVSDIRARAGGGAASVWHFCAPHARWFLPSAAALAVVVGLGRYASWPAARPNTNMAAAPAPRAEPPPRSVSRTTGRLQVTSDPDGASVVVDGRLRGVAPLALDDLTPGTHLVELRTRRGFVRKPVTIRAGETASIGGAIFPGWLVVFAPIELQISENGRAVRLDDNHQVILEPGRHELLLVNQALGYRDVTVVDIKPGERNALSVVTPKTSLTVTSEPPSEVWIDGTRAGDTPLVNAPVDLGARNVVLKNAEVGERHVTVTATVAPVRLDIDLTRPDR